MSKTTIIAAIASAYAVVAATSFALGFLLAPAKAQAGEGENIAREVSPYSLSRRPPNGVIGESGGQAMQQMRLQDHAGSFRIGSVRFPAAEPLDPQRHKNTVATSGAAAD